MVYVDAKLYKNGIPKPLPDHVTLKEVRESMPKQVYEKDPVLAWQSVFVTIASVALSMVVLAYSPWWFLPFAWMLAGTAATGLFVVAHDCGHRSFSDSKLVCDIVGIILMLPLFYPFESWRIQHNLHHNNTNKLHVDNAWQPFQPDYYADAPESERTIMRLIKGPFWYFASIGHMIKEHFFLSSFKPEQRFKVSISLTAVYVGAALFFPTMYYYTGVWGIVKFWLVPWLGYHFWMSTFTMIHHTLPHLHFVDEKEWSDVKARLTMTVHCEYPWAIEFLTHHINVHVPHHVATNIPSYRLRTAWESLQSNWGKHLHETTFGVPLILDIIRNCHLYDKEEAYTTFYSEKTQKYEEERRHLKSKTN